jgi:uncharacterized protein (TIGR02246 family)
MFERYTQSARRVIFFARYEASQSGSGSIDSEHLLLGLFREDKRLARKVLHRPGAAESIRREIEAGATRGERIPMSVEIPLSTQSRRVLQHASDSAEKLGHRQVDSVHLLLGILREQGCVAARILQKYCLAADVIELQSKELLERHDSGMTSVFGSPLPNSSVLELHPAVTELLEAWRARDGERVSHLFEDDGQFWDSQGELWLGSQVKAAIVAYFAACGPGVEAAVVKNVLVLADAAAAVTMAWPSSNVPQELPTRGAHLVVAMRDGAGGWSVASAHLVSL